MAYAGIEFMIRHLESDIRGMQVAHDSKDCLLNNETTVYVVRRTDMFSENVKILDKSHEIIEKTFSDIKAAVNRPVESMFSGQK